MTGRVTRSVACNVNKGGQIGESAHAEPLVAQHGRSTSRKPPASARLGDEIAGISDRLSLGDTLKRKDLNGLPERNPSPKWIWRIAFRDNSRRYQPGRVVAKRATVVAERQSGDSRRSTMSIVWLICSSQAIQWLAQGTALRRFGEIGASQRKQVP